MSIIKPKLNKLSHLQAISKHYDSKRIMFFDDVPQYVDAAAEAGFAAVHLAGSRERSAGVSFADFKAAVNLLELMNPEPSELKSIDDCDRQLLKWVCREWESDFGGVCKNYRTIVRKHELDSFKRGVVDCYSNSKSYMTPAILENKSERFQWILEEEEATREAPKDPIPIVNGPGGKQSSLWFSYNNWKHYSKKAIAQSLDKLAETGTQYHFLFPVVAGSGGETTGCSRYGRWHQLLCKSNLWTLVHFWEDLTTRPNLPLEGVILKRDRSKDADEKRVVEDAGSIRNLLLLTDASYSGTEISKWVENVADMDHAQSKLKRGIESIQCAYAIPIAANIFRTEGMYNVCHPFVGYKDSSDPDKALKDGPGKPARFIFAHKVADGPSLGYSRNEALKNHFTEGEEYLMTQPYARNRYSE